MIEKEPLKFIELEHLLKREFSHSLFDFRTKQKPLSPHRAGDFIQPFRDHVFSFSQSMHC